MGVTVQEIEFLLNVPNLFDAYWIFHLFDGFDKKNLVSYLRPLTP